MMMSAIYLGFKGNFYNKFDSTVGFTFFTFSFTIFDSELDVNLPLLYAIFFDAVSLETTLGLLKYFSASGINHYFLGTNYPFGAFLISIFSSICGFLIGAGYYLKGSSFFFEFSTVSFFCAKYCWFLSFSCYFLGVNLLNL